MTTVGRIRRINEILREHGVSRGAPIFGTFCAVMIIPLLVGVVVLPIGLSFICFLFAAWFSTIAFQFHPQQLFVNRLGWNEYHKWAARHPTDNPWAE